MKKELLYNNFTVNRKLPLNSNIPDFYFPTIKLAESFPASYLYTLNNALIAPHGIVMHNNKIIPESISYAWKGRASRKTFYKRLLLGKIKYIKDPTVIIHNSYYKNYYHWMLEALPRLFSIRDRLNTTTLIIPKKLSSFHHETLALFQPKEIITFSEKQAVWAKNLILPTPLCPDYGQHNPAQIKAMGNWLKEKVPATDNNSPKRIFIVRETDKVRKLINQNNIIELLTEYNFTPVKLEELTITEQINIFRNVTCVVGVQGAGLSNIIYMPKNSLIINLINKQHHDICFFNLANALDHRIIMQQCKTDGETNLHPQHYNMNANITELKNYLDTYLA
jgi:capsular polysaccharide biosynthesis protein